MTKKPNQIRFLFFIRAVMSYLIMILLTSSAFAGSKADTGSKLEKPSTKQLLLEYSTDDHFKDGLKEGGVKGILKGTGKALAFAAPYTARDIVKGAVMLPVKIPMGLYKNIGETSELTSEILNMENKDAHLLLKIVKYVASVPTYAVGYPCNYVYKAGKGFVKKVREDPFQTTLNLVGTYLGVGKILAENKAFRENYFGKFYPKRQKDSQQETPAPVKKVIVI